jgi:hypothetical protein
MAFAKQILPLIRSQEIQLVLAARLGRIPEGGRGALPSARSDCCRNARRASVLATKGAVSSGARWFFVPTSRPFRLSRRIREIDSKQVFAERPRIRGTIVS